MSTALDLRDIQALTTLQGALAGFGGGVRQALAAGRVQMQQTLEWSQQKIYERQGEVEQAQQWVTSLEAALQACECSGGYTPDGYYIPLDCSFEEQSLRRARVFLGNCLKRLETAQAWQTRLQQSAAEFEGVEVQLSRLAGEHTSQAQIVLSQLADRYAAVHAAPLLAASAAPPRPAPRGAWVHRGVQAIAITSLPDPEGISGAADFTKVSETEMRAGLQRLQEMLPLIESGTGASSDYWAGVDRQRGLEHASGFQRIYDAFYGQDAIYVNKDGAAYDIVNGRHRIWLAKQMGISSLPMRVVERQPPQS